MQWSVSCPYCGEANEIVVDELGGDNQEYVEDCQVCCRPWVVTVTVVNGELDVAVRTAGED